VGVEMGVVVVMGAEMAGRLLAVLVMEPAMAAVVPVLRTVPAMVPETAQVTAPPTLRRLRPMMLRLLLLRRVPPHATRENSHKKDRTYSISISRVGGSRPSKRARWIGCGDG
jgi:hypothetical protein